jgi:hypothetical protein
MDELTLLREFRGSAPAAAPSAVRRRVLEGSPRPRPRLPRRLSAVAACGVVLAATATVLALSVGPSAPPSAANVLHRAADQVTTAAPVPTPRADQWIYHRSLEADPETGQPGTHPWDYWSRVDGRQYAERRPNGKIDVQPIVENPLGTPLQWYDLAHELPATPQGVLDMLTRDPLYTSHANKRAARDFDEVTTALTSDTVLPPESIARLYRALAIIPGVSVDRDAPADLSGRPVLSITYNGDSSLGRPGDRWELLLDPDTYRVIGLRGTAGHDLHLKNDTVIPAGTVWFNSAYLAEGVVDEPGQLLD